ncbi:nitrilase-related carbon-nitrogen hydrolase [Consotaella aegiceratis]|uniref:nitrilase-related carbon-nitrogen hydrolase n=1 Tax=Consotaella aegiceratis TaxID=3097961 RepID=UPI002F41BA67
MAVALAVVQMNAALYDGGANRRRSLDFVDEAASAGARLVVLPELAISGYGLDADGLRAAAEPLDGPTLAAWSKSARRHQLWITGGFCEADGDRLYNSVMLVGPDGLVGHYRKLHLFDREKTVFAPGDMGLAVHDTPIGRIGLCVCYDLRFVEVARVLALQDAHVVAVPTAWVGGFDRNPYDSGGFIAQARGAVLQANLNQVYMACASQCANAGRIRFLGSSLVADPFGDMLLEPMPRDKEGIGLALIDPEVAYRARARSELIRPRDDRRTDVYGIAFQGRCL